MLDLKWIRETPAEFDAAMQRRGAGFSSAALLDIDKQARDLQSEIQALQAEGNAIAKDIPAAIKRGEDVEPIKEKGKQIKERIAAMTGAVEAKQKELTELLATIPNAPAADVPQGKDESENKEIRVWGQKPNFTFEPKMHDDLGVALGQMDFEGAAKISGARFVVLKGQLARLERALAAFFLDHNTEQYGYEEVVPPFLVRDNALYGTGQLPKFEEDLFKTDVKQVFNDPSLYEEARAALTPPLALNPQPSSLEIMAKMIALRESKVRPLYLIPTSEVPLTNLVADSILADKDLPIRYTAYTPCFRSEAGAAGRDTRGMIRQHQFSKVEMVSITTPEQSEAEHERMTACAESLLQKLGIPYRVVALCTGDMGFSARKTYDIEAWMPGQNAYREISSCSNCGDFQARRMKARFRAGGEKQTQFVHTLNGSGLPIGRTMVAIIENYQRADGTIAVPDALQPYMGGLKVIGGK